MSFGIYCQHFYIHYVVVSSHKAFQFVLVYADIFIPSVSHSYIHYCHRVFASMCT